MAPGSKPAVDMVVGFIAESVWRGPAPCQKNPAASPDVRGRPGKVFALALAGRSIMARCFGSLFGYRFKFRSSPSSCGFHVRNCARRHRCQQRGDDGLGLVSLRNGQEVGVASREVKVQKLAAGTFNQLAHGRLSVLRCLNQPLGILVSEATTRNQSNHNGLHSGVEPSLRPLSVKNEVRTAQRQNDQPSETIAPKPVVASYQAASRLVASRHDELDLNQRADKKSFRCLLRYLILVGSIVPRPLCLSLGLLPENDIISRELDPRLRVLSPEVATRFKPTRIVQGSWFEIQEWKVALVVEPLMIEARSALGAEVATHPFVQTLADKVI